MKINKTKKIIICVLCLFSLILCMCLPAFAEDGIMPIMNAEDGKITDSGNNAPLDPDAGTVDGGTGDGIIGDASDALDDFSQGASEAASDMLGMGGQGSGTGNVSDSSTTSADGGAAAADGTGVAAAIIICIIIAIAVIVLIIVLKKRD